MSALAAWLLGSAALTLIGSVAFTTAFCGSDWEAPCLQNYIAGWVVIALTVAATQLLTWFLGSRFVMALAVLSVPFQVWFYAGYAIPTAALSSG